MDKWIKENKITTIIIIILVLFFGTLYLQKQPTKTEYQNPKVALNTSDIDLQTKCASQAKIFFDYFISDSQERQSDEYSNHYNATLSKCFVLIKHGITSVNDIYTKNFFDAIEKKQYGSYAWKSQQGKKYWEVPPFDCTIYSDGNQDTVKACKTEEEFDAFVATYIKN